MTAFRLTTSTASNNSNKSTVFVEDQNDTIMKRQKKLSANNNSTEDEIDSINKPKRKRISPEQFCLLTELFQQTDTPSHEIRERLAKKLNMTNREVQVWFQNRRAKVNRSRLQEQEEHISNMMNKKVKFNYWSTTTITPPLTATTTTTTSSSSSLTSSPSLLPHDLIFHPDVTPIDILATAAAYVQRWDENVEQRKRKQEELTTTICEPKRKSWRPWL
ncbi:unnamed protein product [Mucor hiemalis]